MTSAPPPPGGGAYFNKILSGETDRVRFQRRLIRGDDAFIWVNAITSAIRDSEGNLEYAVRIIEDITESKQVALAKDELMALTSHELKTPVTSIHAALGLAAAGALGELPEKAQAMITIAAENSERLVSLVQDILDLEGMRIGRVPLKSDPCDSTTLLQKTAELLSTAAAQRNISLILNSPVAHPLTGDYSKILQVLTNLVGNSLKFAPQDSSIELGCTASNGYSIFSITDHGPGIPRNQQQLIFERFRQADNSATRNASGTGLGLAIAKAIVEGHGGRIWVESTVGEGCTFSFSLPLATPTPAA